MTPIKIRMYADGEICIAPRITRHQAILLIEACLLEAGDEFLRHVMVAKIEERTTLVRSRRANHGTGRARRLGRGAQGLLRRQARFPRLRPTNAE